jgi:hypothetical protein
MGKGKSAEKKKKTAQIHSPHVTYPVGLARQYWNRWAKRRAKKTRFRVKRKKKGGRCHFPSDHRAKRNSRGSFLIIEIIEWLDVLCFEYLAICPSNLARLHPPPSEPDPPSPVPSSLPPGDHPHSLTVWAPATAVPFEPLRPLTDFGPLRVVSSHPLGLSISSLSLGSPDSPFNLQTPSPSTPPYYLCLSRLFSRLFHSPPKPSPNRTDLSYQPLPTTLPTNANYPRRLEPFIEAKWVNDWVEVTNRCFGLARLLYPRTASSWPPLRTLKAACCLSIVRAPVTSTILPSVAFLSRPRFIALKVSCPR